MKNKPREPEISIAMLLKSQVGGTDSRNVGGTERVFFEDIKYFKKNNLSVKAYSRFKTFNVEKLYYPKWLLFINKYSTLLLKKENLIYDILDCFYVLQFIFFARKESIYIGYSIPLLGIFRPKKTIITLHNIDCRFPLIVILGFRYKEVLFLTCSKHLQKKIIKKYPILKDNCKVLYNGVDTNFFKPDIKKKKNKYINFLFASAWVEDKGLDVLLEAIILLPKKLQKKIYLTISSNERMWYSDFPKENAVYIEKINSLLKKIDNVSLLHGVFYNKMPQIYIKSDYSVMPSIWDEPFGLVALESISCGTPVIYFDTGGLKEILENENSICIKEKRVETLSNLIKLIVEKKISINAKKGESLLTKKNSLMNFESRYHHFNKYFSKLI